jgi:polar amino acid transport system substrate-binding protein
MRKFFLLVVFSLQLIAGMLTLSVAEKEFIAQNKKVKVALMPDFTPFSYIDRDRIMGFEHDLLELISYKTGLEFEKEFGVWHKNLKSFQTNKVDIISSISYKKEREPFTKYTAAYYKIPIMIFVRDDFGRYRGLESLKGKKVGVLKDVFYEKEVKGLDGIEAVVYKTYEDMTEALVFGRIDALVQNLTNINYLIKKNLYSNLVLADELKLPTIPEEDLRFGINPQKPLLHAIMQKGLDGISEQEWEILSDRWMDVSRNRLKPSYDFTKSEREYLDTEVVKYCIDPYFEPFEFLDKNGEHRGFTKDYLDLIVAKTKMKVQFVPTTSWTQTLEFLKTKKCDMTLAVANTYERQEFLSFTDTYLNFPQVVAMQSDAAFVASMDDLLNKKVAIVKDYALGDLLAYEYDDFSFIEVENTQEGLKRVSQGKVDAFIDFLPVMSTGIRKAATGNLKIAGKIDETVPLSAAVRGDDIILYSILQKTMQLIQPQEHAQILDKWMTIRYEHGVDYTLVWQIVFVATAILLLFAYWTNKIRQAKKIIEKQNKELEIMAKTDKMTGIYNRSKLDEILSQELQRAQRYSQYFGCAVVDIDNFKRINDTYGHLAGDKAIKELASVIQKSMRKSDYFGRWGGEEFLIISVGVDKNGLRQMLEKIRILVSEHEIKGVGKQTVSIGAAIYRQNDTEDSIIKRADDALYKAKNSGRNTVVIEDDKK